MPNFYMCRIQMSSKYVWGIVLIASSLENKHVGLIQSRVQERAQKGVNEVSLSLSHWYPGSGVVLDCIDS